MIGKSLRIIRIVLQVAVMLALTAALLAAPTAAVIAWRKAITGWMLLPLSFGSMLFVVSFWVAVTLIFGRVYCSVMCPVGTLQDIAARLSRLPGMSGRRRVYRYSPSSPWYVKAGMIAVLIMAAGLGAVATQWALMPFIQVSPVDSYELIVDTLTPAHTDAPTHHHAWRLMVAAGVNLLFITAMGIFRGRTLCNTLCPLGAALGTLNTMAMFQIDIDTDRCTRCRRCEYACKAMCINVTEGTVDSSRCVACFDCLAACRDGAIRYTTRRHKLSIPMLQRVDSPKPALTDNVSSSDNVTN